MDLLNKEKRSLTPEIVIEEFRKNGINMSIKEAEEYLDLLYFFANLIVEQNLL